MNIEQNVPSPQSAPHPFPIPRYHDELFELLQRTEPELWAWFESQLRPDLEAAAASELELLKTAYRMEPGDANGLDADASILAGKLQIEMPVTCYQSLHPGQSNAEVRVLDAPDGGHTIHIVFSGELLSVLSPAEKRAVLAHELAHVSLLLEAGGRYRVLAGLVDRLIEHRSNHDPLNETARRLRIHTEVFADAASAHITEEPDDLISSLVKIQSGISHVDPAAYRRQAEQILGSEDGPTQAWTHPELHVRVACLTAMGTPNGRDLVAQLIEGPDDLDRLDLLGLERIRSLTADVIRHGLATTGLCEGHRSYVSSFVDNPEVLDLATSSAFDAPPLDLTAVEPSIRQLAAALLVDLVLTVDDTDDVTDRALHQLSDGAGNIGVASEFDRLLSKATGRTLAEVRKLRS